MSEVQSGTPTFIHVLRNGAKIKESVVELRWLWHVGEPEPVAT